MSEKPISAEGEEKRDDKPEEKITKLRRRRKKPKPEPADDGKAKSSESEKPSPRPKRKKRPPEGQPKAASSESERPEGTPRPPRRKKRRPKPKDVEAAAKRKEKEKEEPPAPVEDKILLQWSVHLFKRRQGISALVLALVAMATYFGYWLFDEWFLAVLVLLISIGALSAYFFPISYTLSERGMKMANFLAREEKEWKDFWTYVHYADGVHLSYDQRRLKGRVRQGVMLYYDDKKELKDTITEIVSTRLPPPEQVGLDKRKR